MAESEPARAADVAPELTDVIEDVEHTLRERAPWLGEKAGQNRLEGPDRRIAWGIAIRDETPVVALLVERKDTWAVRQAEKLQKERPDAIIVQVTGRAHSSRPKTMPRQRI